MGGGRVKHDITGSLGRKGRGVGVVIERRTFSWGLIQIGDVGIQGKKRKRDGHLYDLRTRRISRPLLAQEIKNGY